MSLDRLIDLAKKTGDRLIIHDRFDDSAMVIMDIDSYEQLIIGRSDIREMNESQMLDQIDRDISIWRANQETEMDEFDDEMPTSPWSSAGGILDDRYGGKTSSAASNKFFCEDEDCDDLCEEDSTEDELVSDEVNLTSSNTVPITGEEHDRKAFTSEEWDELMPTSAPQPIAPITVPVPNPKGESEPLPGDEPVFYEEPV